MVIIKLNQTCKALEKMTLIMIPIPLNKGYHNNQINFNNSSLIRINRKIQIHTTMTANHL